MKTNDLEELRIKLIEQFPEYEFRIGKRIYGQCIIAKKSKYSGADVFIKKDKILIEASVPEMKTRLLLGAGAVFLKFFRKDFGEPCQRIAEYLIQEDYKVKIKQ